MGEEGGDGSRGSTCGCTVRMPMGLSHCYVIEVFFPLLILDLGAICPAFHASLTPGWRLDLTWPPGSIPPLVRDLG